MLRYTRKSYALETIADSGVTLHCFLLLSILNVHPMVGPTSIVQVFLRWF